MFDPAGATAAFTPSDLDPEHPRQPLYPYHGLVPIGRGSVRRLVGALPRYDPRPPLYVRREHAVAEHIIATVERDDTIHPAHLAALRRATPAEKLAAVASLYQAGIQLRVAGLRMTHPDWTDERRELEARQSLRRAGT